MRTRKALEDKARREGREARAAFAPRTSCPYGPLETIARDAWLGGYRTQKLAQFLVAYSPQENLQ